ncbi:MAG: hypothetical protein ACT4PU_05575 [Planctomycetota bacterium]
MTLPRSRAGFVLLSVLLLTALVVGLTMTYARSAILAGDAAPGSRGRMEVQTVMDSGLAYAQQSLLTDRPTTAVLSAPTGDSVRIDVDPAGDALRALDIRSSSGGRAGQVSALAEVHLAAGGALPTLTEATRAAVLASPRLITINANTTYANTTVDGILLVTAGRKLTLRDVVLTGTIIGAAAMSDAAVGDDTVKIELEGSVLIEPDALLSGCAVVAPGSEVELASSARLQCEGVLVAREFDVKDSTTSARLHGQLVVAESAGVHAGIVQVGVGRGPQAWPACLQSGSQGITRLVFDRRLPSDSERSAIQAFSLSGWNGGQAAPVGGADGAELPGAPGRLP